MINQPNIKRLINICDIENNTFVMSAALDININSTTIIKLIELTDNINNQNIFGNTIGHIIF
jgi:hypothetical protein